MKKATLIAILVTLSSFTFAAVNVTWGNTYESGASNALGATTLFGVWFDINDGTSVGWEDGDVMVGLNGPQSTTLRLGLTNGSSLGVGWDYDLGGGGTGWGTTVGTSVDFVLTTDTASTPTYTAGDFTINVNLGLGF